MLVLLSWLLWEVLVYRRGSKRKRDDADGVTAIDAASKRGPSSVSGIPHERHGLSELSNPEREKTLDIIAVHGLQGDAFKTWQYENGPIWIRDFLLKDLPFARIFTYGYESAVFGNSAATIEDKALSLLNKIPSL